MASDPLTPPMGSNTAVSSKDSRPHLGLWAGIESALARPGMFLFAATLIFAMAAWLRWAGIATAAFWLDEAWVVHKASVSYEEYKAIYSNHPMPTFFIHLTRYMAATFGVSEISMRLQPLLFGIGTVGCGLAVLKHIAPARWIALLGGLVLATAPRLLDYSNQVKAFSGEAFFAVACLLVLVSWRPQRGKLYWMGATLTLLMAVAFGHGTTLLLPPFFLVALYRSRTLDGQPRSDSWLNQEQTRWFAMGVVVAGAFLVNFVLTVLPSDRGIIFDYWADAFVPWTEPLSIPRWLARRLASLIHFALPTLVLPAAAAHFLLMCLGGRLAWATEQGRSAALYVFGVLGTALFAAALWQFPFYDRVLLLTVPLMILMIAMGVGALAVAKKPLNWSSLAAVGLLLVPASIGAKEALQGRPNEETRGPIRFIEKELRSGDTIYLYHAAVPAFRVYFKPPPALSTDLSEDVPLEQEISRHGRKQSLFDGKIIEGRPLIRLADIEQDLNTRLPSSGRVWFLLAHPSRKGNHRERLVQYFEQRGDLLLSDSDVGAEVHLYDLNQPKPVVAPDQAPAFDDTEPALGALMDH